MISINFQPFNKSMTEVIEYMTRKIQKIRLESPKTRLRNFPRNILSPRAGRGREMTLTLRMIGTISTVQFSWYDQERVPCPSEHSVEEVHQRKK